VAREPAPRKENLRAGIEDLYGPLKALSEAEVRKHFGERSTIVRPGYIVGPRDETERFTYWPPRVAQGGEILVPGDGLDPVQIIDGRDLGEWMIRLAEARAYACSTQSRLRAGYRCDAARHPGRHRRQDFASTALLVIAGARGTCGP